MWRLPCLLLVACVPAHPLVLSSANAASAENAVSPDALRCPVAGTYISRTVEVSDDPPGCSFAEVQSADQGDTVTVTVGRAGVAVAIRDVSGVCDGGTLHGCTLTSSCNLQAPGLNGTLQIEWTFDASGFSGIQDLRAFPESGPACRLRTRERGTRRE